MDSTSPAAETPAGLDFREPAARWVDEVDARGGLLSVNHPTDADCSWLHPLPVLPPAVELWHISWFRDLSATTPWAYLELWRSRLPAGDLPVLLGGSDLHTSVDPWHPGTPTTRVLTGRTSLSVGTRPDATVDPFGSPVLRHMITTEHQRFSTEGRPPWRLEDAHRRALAITS